MRPALLDRLFAPVTVLSGIGPQLGRLFERAAGPLVVDLLWHLPPGVGGRRPYRVLVSDGTGLLALVYFSVKGDYLARLLPVGAERVISGHVEYYGSAPQIAHPDYVLPPEQ